MIKHGRESLVKISDGKFVSKEPLPGRSLTQRREWLARQQKAADTIQKLHEIGNNAYGVPHIKSVDSKRFCVLEERVSGVPLTPLLFRNLDNKTREKLIDALAQFYADIHSIDVIPNPIEYKMEYGLSVSYLDDFIDGGMARYFPKSDVKFVEKMYQNHYDMLRSYAYDLGVADAVRARYLNYRDARYLPADFTDDARWKKIAEFHNAAAALEQMNENLSDFQYLSKDERKRTLARVKRQIVALHKFEH